MADLTDEQRASLQAWLSERHEEMRPDAKSIREEDPHLMPAIRALLGALKPRKPSRRTNGVSAGNHVVHAVRSTGSLKTACGRNVSDVNVTHDAGEYDREYICKLCARALIQKEPHGR
jgi:hypothetical protein